MPFYNESKIFFQIRNGSLGDKIVLMVKKEYGLFVHLNDFLKNSVTLSYYRSSLLGNVQNPI